MELAAFGALVASGVWALTEDLYAAHCYGNSNSKQKGIVQTFDESLGTPYATHGYMYS